MIKEKVGTRLEFIGLKSIMNSSPTAQALWAQLNKAYEAEKFAQRT